MLRIAGGTCGAGNHEALSDQQGEQAWRDCAQEKRRPRGVGQGCRSKSRGQRGLPRLRGIEGRAASRISDLSPGRRPQTPGDDAGA